MQIRRTAVKLKGAEDRFKKMLLKYASKSRRNGKWPSWYHDTDEHTYAYPQPHPSTKDHKMDWNKDIEPVGPIGLLIESVAWHGMAIDGDLRIWQQKRTSH